MTVREEVLNAAKKCVCGGREEDYGSPEDNFTTIGRLWSVYTGHEYSALDVAIMMALLKVARIKGGIKKDSFVDLAGYAACAAEIAEKYGIENKIGSFEQPDISLADGA